MEANCEGADNSSPETVSYNACSSGLVHLMTISAGAAVRYNACSSGLVHFMTSPRRCSRR